MNVVLGIARYFFDALLVAFLIFIVMLIRKRMD